MSNTISWPFAMIHDNLHTRLCTYLQEQPQLVRGQSVHGVAEGDAESLRAGRLEHGAGEHGGDGVLRFGRVRQLRRLEESVSA